MHLMKCLVTCKDHYILWAMSYPNDGVPYQGQCILYYVSSKKNSFFLKKVWAL